LGFSFSFFLLFQSPSGSKRALSVLFMSSHVWAEEGVRARARARAQRGLLAAVGACAGTAHSQAYTQTSQASRQASNADVWHIRRLQRRSEMETAKMKSKEEDAPPPQRRAEGEARNKSEGHNSNSNASTRSALPGGYSKFASLAWLPRSSPTVPPPPRSQSLCLSKRPWLLCQQKRKEKRLTRGGKEASNVSGKRKE